MPPSNDQTAFLWSDSGQTVLDYVVSCNRPDSDCVPWIHRAAYGMETNVLFALSSPEILIVFENCDRLTVDVVDLLIGQLEKFHSQKAMNHLRVLAEVERIVMRWDDQWIERIGGIVDWTRKRGKISNPVERSFGRYRSEPAL